MTRLLDDGRYQILVPLADDEGDARGDRPIEAGRKIVKNDDALAGREERVDHVAADVAGAAGDQDRHVWLFDILALNGEDLRNTAEGDWRYDFARTEAGADRIVRFSV
jgi:hypothetical protein